LEGHLDRILNKVTKRATRLVGDLEVEFKGMKTPFREKIPLHMKKWAVDNLGLQDMQDLLNEFGDEAVDYLLYQVNKPDNRRR
jgi:hypothetical protein